tara:strand:- start:879 stop:1247 length:369 start_codon:yes stop_codon:yes gene_type:complete
MQIINKTTWETINLCHTSYASDVLRDLTAQDDGITYDADRGIYLADSGTIEWWQAWIAGDEEVQSMLAEIPIDQQHTVLDACDCVEMGDQPKVAKAALIQWASERGKIWVTYSDGSLGLVSD